jgi:hypothetical protein
VNPRLLRSVPIALLAAPVAFVLSGATSTAHALSNQVSGVGQLGPETADNTPGVAPRGSSPHGMTYEQWAGALIHWAFSQPAGVGVMMDSTAS